MWPALYDSNNSNTGSYYFVSRVAVFVFVPSYDLLDLTELFVASVGLDLLDLVDL